MSRPRSRVIHRFKTAANPTANGFTLNDGSGVALTVANTGDNSSYDGAYVVVTGISSIGPGGARLIKAVSVDVVE